MTPRSKRSSDISKANLSRALRTPIVRSSRMIVEDYERKRWPIEPPDAIDAISYRMEMGGFTQADLGRLLVSRQRASDVLKGKRPLTMSMAWRLRREWGIPAEALIAPPPPRRRSSAA
jgi:HTH-type transcriptional regulator/antitoxin HigA